MFIFRYMVTYFRSMALIQMNRGMIEYGLVKPYFGGYKICEDHDRIM